MRSLGVTMSVRRMPNLSLTTTTSPCAMRKPLTSTSIGYLIAQGEVVVVNDKFGIRLTDIVTPSERMRRVSKG